MKKILVVDDDQDLLVVLRSFLEKNGYDVRVSISCEEGLQIFYSFQPDLVLLDINVGNEDGLAMCKKIKTQSDFLHIPVILISANHDALKFYQDFYANSYVEKPFKLNNLRQVVEMHS